MIEDHAIVDHDTSSIEAAFDISLAELFVHFASAASHDIGARNAIETFLKSTKLWRCCEYR